MAEKPLVSAIVTVYNAEPYVAPALDSIFAQDYRPLEVIVVDDGSTDGSAAIARSYPEVIYIYQPNGGPAIARNTGLRATHGEFIAFLDVDDTWTPDKLRLQVDHLLANPSVGFVFARARLFLEPGLSPPGWLRKELLHKEQAVIAPSTLVARRTVFDQVGHFDPGYKFGDDSDWIFRARDAGVRLEVLPRVLLHKRIHGANLSSRKEEMHAEMLKIIGASVRRNKGREQGTSDGE